MLELREVQRWERLTAAMIRKAGRDDPEAFAQAVAILDTIPAQLREAVRELRKPIDTDGLRIVPAYSWADIARPLGITRSAACQKYGT